MKSNYLNIDEVKVISLYEEGQSSYTIAKTFNCSSKKILSVLKKNNVDRRPSNTTTFAHNIDSSFFEKIDNEAKAYFLGLLYADGCNYESNNNVNLFLQPRDKHIIEEFKNALNFSGRVIERKKLGETKAYGISFKNKKISADLAKLGCIKNKSKSLEKLPDLNEDLMCHFIRGYFDGDGTVYKHYKYNSLYFSIIGLSPVIDKIQDILIKNCNLSKTKLYSHRNKQNKYFVYGGSTQVYRIFNYLYPHETKYKLNRKHTKFITI
jgi:intein-encoded DNA endonuclease-like protein